MLVRLLVAVLMLTGPLPVRVCTCAAAARPTAPVAPADQARPGPASPAPETKGCGCRKKASAETDAGGAAAPVAPAGERSSEAAGGGHSHPDRQPHERDCPAVNPAPVVTAVVPSSAADAPADEVLSLPLWVEPAGGGDARGVCRPERHQVFRSVPLYISLLTLRN